MASFKIKMLLVATLVFAADAQLKNKRDCFKANSGLSGDPVRDEDGNPISIDATMMWICQDACEAEPACEYWVWKDKNNFMPNKCWLKAGEGELKEKPNSFAGSKACMQQRKGKGEW